MPLKFWSRKSRGAADKPSQPLTSGTPSASVHETSRPSSIQSSSQVVVPIIASDECSSTPSVTVPGQNLPVASPTEDETTAATPLQAADNGDDLRERLWSQAYEILAKREPELVKDYLKHLRGSEGEDLDTDAAALSNPDQLKTAIADLLASRENEQWKIQLAGRKVKVREQVENLVRLLSFSDKIIKDALSAQPYAALAWSGVSMFLPLISVAGKQHTEMIAGFDIISAEQMYWMDWVDKNLSSIHREHYSTSAKQLCELYSYILEYQALAVCHLSDNQLRRAWQKMTGSDDWSKKHADVELHSKRCKELIGIGRQEESRRNADIQYQLLKSISGATEDLVRVTEGIKQDDDKSKLIALLSSATPLYEDCKSEVADKTDGTCEWFFNDTSFKTWRDTDSSGLFWLSADPGCGKSVLSKAVIDGGHLRTATTTFSTASGRTTTASTASTICYFFFKDDDESRRNGTHALCSILHQLFINDNTESLVRYGIESYKKDHDSLAHSLPQLWKLLVKCSEQSRGNIVCVLDALDECGKTSREKLLGNLKELFKRNDTSPKAKLKFFITSRPYIDLETAFKHFQSYTTYLRLDGAQKAAEISKDINLVIDKRLEVLGEDRCFSKADVNQLAKHFKSLGTRTYLWLYLTMGIIEEDAVEYEHVSDIQDFVSHVGSDVSKAYEKILNRIKDSEKTKKLLQILLAATRPLTLTEANYALRLAMKSDGYNSLTELKTSLSKDNFEQIAKNLCGLLIQVHDSRISFIHLTAREFLLKDPEPAMKWKGLFSNEPMLHSILAKCCIDQLSLSGVPAQRRSAEVDEESPFVLYAASNWPYHYQISQYAPNQQANDRATAKLVHVDGHYIEVWGPVYIAVHTRQLILREYRVGESRLKSWDGWTDLAIASYLGLCGTVRHLLQQDPSTINSSHPTFGTALYAACKRGRDDVVRILLAHGADANPTGSNRQPMLRDVLNFRRLSTVKLALEGGTLPEVINLESFAASQRPEVLGLIEKAGWEKLANTPVAVSLAVNAWPFDQGRLLKYLVEKYGDDLSVADSIFTVIHLRRDIQRTTKPILSDSSNPELQRHLGVDFYTNAWLQLTRFLLQNFPKKLPMRDCLWNCVLSGDADMVRLLLEFCDGSTLIDAKMLRHCTNNGVFKLLWQNCTLNDREKENSLMVILEYGKSDAQKAVAEIVTPLLESQTPLTESWLRIAAECIPAKTMMHILDSTRKEYITPRLLLSALKNREPSLEVIQSICNRCEMEVTEDILCAAARRQSRDIMSIILKNSSHNAGVSRKVVEAALHSRLVLGYSVAVSLLKGHKITDSLIMNAMEMNDELMVRYLLTQQVYTIEITDDSLYRAAMCRNQTIFQAVLEHLPAQRRISPEVVARLWSEPERVLQVLCLHYIGGIPWTDGLLSRVVRSWSLEKMELLLDHCDEKLELAERLLSQILERGSSEQMLILLKKYGGSSIITSDTIRHAVSNEGAGDTLVHILLDWTPNFQANEGTIKAALLNKELGRAIVDILIKRTRLDITSADSLAKTVATEGHYRQLKALASAVHVSEEWLTIAQYFEAAKAGNSKEVQRHIDAGLPPDIEGDQGVTALWVAAGSQYGEDVVKFLANLDAVNVNKASSRDCTSPLFNAVANDTRSTILTLLRSGADPRQLNHFNQSPLHFARSHKVVAALLEAGADAQLRDSKGCSPLHSILTNEFEWGTLHIAVRYLIDGGADVQCLNDDGQSVLHCIHSEPETYRKEAAKRLVEAGANINIQDLHQRSPLQLAAMHGHLPLVDSLLRAGADYELVDKDGRTALHLAALHGHSQVLECLLEKRASTEIRDASGKTVLDLAEESQDFDSIYLLKRFMSGEYYF